MDDSNLVIVTGAANGIGFALARHLVKADMRVAMLDRDEEKVSEASKALNAEGAMTYPFALDVRDETAIREIAALIESSAGPAIGLATCAGIIRSRRAETMVAQDFQDVIDVNITGTFLSCQIFGGGMLERGRGSIVTVSSVAGTGGQGGRANYVASKWAVIGLTKTLAIEWGSRGVRVNSIAPGAVNTQLFSKSPAQYRENVLFDRTPLGRAAEAEEIAAPMAFLLSDAASYVNGAVLVVDGGLTAGYATHKQGMDAG